MYTRLEWIDTKFCSSLVRFALKIIEINSTYFKYFLYIYFLCKLIWCDLYDSTRSKKLIKYINYLHIYHLFQIKFLKYFDRIAVCCPFCITFRVFSLSDNGLLNIQHCSIQNQTLILIYKANQVTFVFF